MKNLNFYGLLCILLAASTAWAQPAAQVDVLKSLQEIAIIDQKVMMPMRDGVRLATDIYRPKGDKKVPVIFSKTPYNFNSWSNGEQRNGTYQAALEAVKRGYAYVVQNERGRYFSEGNWDILGPPTTDGYDAVDWLSKQAWSNGKVAPIGCSSTAEWQMAVVALNHPALATFIPQSFGAGVGRVGKFYEQGNWYRGGAGQMLFTAWLYDVQNDEIRPQFPRDATQDQLIRAARSFDLDPERERIDWSKGLAHLPLQDIVKKANGPKGVYEDMIRRKPNDPAWYKGGLYHDNMPIERPGFWFVSWYDVSSSPNIALYNHVRNTAKDPNVRNNQYLVIAPVLHCSYKRATENTIIGERSVGDARLNYDDLTYGWFDYWLKGEQNGILQKTPKVQYYTMGLNKWQSSEVWPPANAQMTTYFLNSGGKANSLYGDGKLSTTAPKSDAPDGFTYDPLNPVPSYGGNVCCTGNAVQGGAYDQQKMETRNDILVYTTEPLAEGVEVSGFIETTLYVSSDAKDTDFTIKLIDVYPDGKAYNLDETIQRLRYREGYEKEVFMEKGKVYKVDLSVMSTSNYFEKGHRIRIEISSSNFPRFDRNMNTGGNNYDEAVGVIARNNVHHSAVYPSQVRLPILKK
ncbi:CocE/NonD family hydrolase [Haliscomenobacter sp.]|uniref:CocE/NonD family hydrolase n=1 Tax=Haliscomenobacter sp. TaxID=2717303 RepID=UPI003364B9A5